MASIDHNPTLEAPSRTGPIDVRPLIVLGAGNRRIFRLLMPGTCSFSCDDCPLAAQARFPKHANEPNYLARLFMSAYRRGLCDGLFLMAGVPRNPVAAMGGMLGLVELLRTTYGYRGYLHVKALRDAEPGQLERLLRLADRVSFQLEPRCARAAGIPVVETAAERSVKAEKARRHQRAHQALLPRPVPARRSQGLQAVQPPLLDLSGWSSVEVS